MIKINRLLLSKLWLFSSSSTSSHVNYFHLFSGPTFVLFCVIIITLFTNVFPIKCYHHHHHLYHYYYYHYIIIIISIHLINSIDFSTLCCPCNQLHLVFCRPCTTQTHIYIRTHFFIPFECLLTWLWNVYTFYLTTFLWINLLYPLVDHQIEVDLFNLNHNFSHK